MYRIYIVEDHETIRNAYHRLIDRQADMSVCGMAASGAEALAQIPGLAPDLVLVDLSLPDMDGFALIEQLLALAWATCLNATARVIVGNTTRTAVRVEVELHPADPGPGYEFHADAYLSVEGADTARTERVLHAAHARCPVSKLLHGAATARVHPEPYSG